MDTDVYAMALTAWQEGRFDEARRMLGQFLADYPNNVQGRHFYAVVQTQAGDYEAAIKQLHMVCAAEPENEEAWSDLANAQCLAGKLADAESALRMGIGHNPDSPNLWFNLGALLNGLKRHQEAEAAFLHTTELDPNDQASWTELGLLRFARSDHLSAAHAFLYAADLDGEDKAKATRLAGFALADGGRPEQAERLLASLCPASPQDTEDFHLLSQLLFCRLELCDWRQIPEMVARCKQFVAEGRAPLEPFTFLLLPELTAKEQSALTASFARLFTSGEVVQGAVARDLSPARRLRIAYLSADFHDHAVMRLLAGVLERHNHMDFEIHAFSYGGSDGGEMRRRIVAACDFFHDISVFSPESMAQSICAEKIDILIDLTGWTGNTKSAVLAFRPAPIQVNWLGYTGTIGSRRLADYLIGDPVATPLADQDNFAEELILMPVCCQPNDASRRIGNVRTRAEEGLPESGFVFCCFSRPLKITPELFRCWCGLLAGTPGSVLWLLDANETAKENLATAATRHGIDASRLVFSVARAPDEHLARLSLADLALDTFPFGAHTTASDALWAGVPVVTRIGDTFPSRVTASMLNAIGLNGLVADSRENYCALALELACNAELLGSIRKRLELNRLSSPLFDTRGFAIELEALFRGMWRRHCRNGSGCA
ncbi:MAG: hypothetical protein FD157_95 [Rhodocyclaceae bacterium]|nr:MAG: hypothetical protein FD157_95 [Rhodocyclaceae bacterium]TND04913.1 MAG: hypothetical protein FD118_732 [Rhodocyclaceae bacterium]